jgi:beta-lactamase regulating signal transducer with metallopeptidase domain
MTDFVLTYIANAAVQTTLIAAVTLLLARALAKAPARMRFTLVAVSLALAAVAPAVTPLFAGGSAAAPPLPIAAKAITPRFATIIALLYALGAVVAAARLLIAAARARRLLRESHPYEGDIRLSDAIASPMTIGARILIPRSLAGNELLPAAIAHERAHVRRRDFALNALLEVMAVPVWFHPAALLLRRELAVLREMACDEEAAGRGGAQYYAAALVRLAALAAQRDPVALAMTATSIERRIHRLRRPARSPRTARAATIATIVLPLALAAACTRVAVPPAAAQNTLCGIWRIVPEESDFRSLRPSRYDEFTQWVAQGGRRIHVRQRRVAGGRADEHEWSLVTDGRWRSVDGVPGAAARATWSEGRLSIERIGPGRHREHAVAAVRGDRMICDGTADSARYHAVFQREE